MRRRRPGQASERSPSGRHELRKRQVERYLVELNEEYPGPTPWTGRVETYIP
jgi:hypothetical protein